MNSKLYDCLKWVALIVFPGLATLYSTLAEIWGFPYINEIPQTIYALDLFLGTMLGISTLQYNHKNK